MELKFPKGFLWGTATSTHQVEGGNNNDWAEWENDNAGRLAEEAENRWQLWQREKFPEMFRPENYVSGRACDFYNRFESDLDLAASLGNNAFRFSVEWSRIEPEEGKFDQSEIDYCRQILWACRQRNLEPFVTLWHWTLPLWVAKKGGFQSGKNLFYFERFAKRMAEELGSEIKFWITLNEPEIYAASYLKGLWPHKKRSPFLYLKVLMNLIWAHRRIHKILKGINSNFQVGIAKNNVYFEAHQNRLPDYFLKKGADFWWNCLFLNKTRLHSDFIGLNYYFHSRVKNGRFNQNENKEMSDLGWEIYPEGIYHVLKGLKAYNKPVYVMENGLADAKDEKRAKFIKEHLAWIHKAIREGVDVRGYFHWSLLDNFEWDKGFWPRFGLFEVDYRTLERRKRPSADYYASICKNNDLADI